MTRSATACPSASQLEGVAAGLPADDVLGAHVEACAACQAAIKAIRENNAFITANRIKLVKAAGEAETHAPIPSDAIPGYRLLEELHRGGQGVVYTAIQESTQQKVAVKILRAGAFAGAGERARFEREVYVLARLNHPGIVTIHDSGVARGQHYLVTKLIDGDPLDEWIVDSAERPLDTARSRVWPARRSGSTGGIRRAARGADRVQGVLSVLAKVCDAVHAAHMRGVIHRDLKPGNILVDSDGHPHVLDFGLAKLIDADPSVESYATQSGHFLGSLPWASPEQAQGSQADVDVRTDVYALGVMLYRALTNRFPYEVTGPIHQVLDSIINAEPPRPSSVRRGLNREIDTIVLKALAKDKARRYQSVAALRDDLLRYVRGDPLEARRDSTWYVLRKAAQRHKLPLLAAAVLLALVSAFAVQRSRYVRSLESALHEANIERGRIEGRAGNLALAESFLWREHLRSAASARTPAGGGARDSYWSLWELYAHHPCVSAWDARIDPTAIELAGTADRLALIGDTGPTQVWDLTDPAAPRLVFSLENTHGPARAGDISKDGRFLVVGDRDGWIRVFDARDGHRVNEWPAHDAEVYVLAIHPDAKTLVSSATDGTVHLWRLSDGTRIGTVPADGLASSLSFAPDGRMLAVGLPDADRIDLFSVPALERAASLDISALTADLQRHDHIRQVFSPDGKLIAAACYRFAAVWDASTGRLLARHWHELFVNGLAFVTGDQLATAVGGTIRLWDLNSHELRQTYTGHSVRISSLSFIHDANLLASVSIDGQVRLWEPRPLAARTSIPRRDAHCVAYSADGRWLASCGETGSAEGNVQLWDAHTHALVWETQAHDADRMSAVAFQSDGRSIANAAYEDPRIRVSTLSSGVSREWPTEHGGIACLALSTDGRFLAAGDNVVGLVTLWDAQSGRLIARFEDDRGRVPTICFDPTSELLVSGSRLGTITICEVANRSVVRVIEAHRGAVRTVAYHPNRGRFASAGDDGVIRLWNERSGRKERERSGHRGAVYALCFSPDGTLLASGGFDGAIRLWDASLDTLLATIETGTGVISSISFHPDGDRLAFGAFGEEIGVIDLTYFDRHIAGNLEYQINRLPPGAADASVVRGLRSWASGVLRRERSAERTSGPSPAAHPEHD